MPKSANPHRVALLCVTQFTPSFFNPLLSWGCVAIMSTHKLDSLIALPCFSCLVQRLRGWEYFVDAHGAQTNPLRVGSLTQLHLAMYDVGEIPSIVLCLSVYYE